MDCSNASGKSDTNSGIIVSTRAPVGIKLFKVIGPAPEERFPSPLLYPVPCMLNGLAQISSVSSARLGVPDLSLLLASK